MILKSTLKEGYVLENNGEFWGVEWIEYGCETHGIVDDISKAIIFEKPIKPCMIDVRFNERGFIGYSSFKKVAYSMVEKIDFID